MATGILVQVRLGSLRLPAKALLPLPGGSIIQHVMRALRGIPADVRAIATDSYSAPRLRPVAEQEGFEVVVGPADDVLERYCVGCRAYKLDRVIRATGDNPLVSARLGSEILVLHQSAGADLSHFLGNPWGTGVEVVQASALYAAEREAMQRDEREHITTFVYGHRERFNILEPQAPGYGRLPEARVTVDTREDYERVRRIFQELYTGDPIEVDQVIAWFGRGGSSVSASESSDSDAGGGGPFG